MDDEFLLFEVDCRKKVKLNPYCFVPPRHEQPNQAQNILKRLRGTIDIERTDAENQRLKQLED